MARILGVEIADEKRSVIGLTGIYGVGLSTSQSILKALDISFDKKIGTLNAEEKKKILTYIGANYKVEGALRAEKMLAIKRLMDIGCYIGKRHRETAPYEANVPKIIAERRRCQAERDKEKKIISSRKNYL